MNKILTVSIAAYNAEKDISRCLDSLINSKKIDDLDIIIVNDGSTDKTPIIANDYVSKYPNSIKVIDKKNGGHGSTINTSIGLATGKYYKILDSDDWVNSRNFADFIDDLKNYDADMVLNQYEEVNYYNREQKTLREPNIDNIIPNVIHNIEEITKDTILYMHSLTFRTDVMKKMGGIIDENCFYVDMEYCIFPLLYVSTFLCLEYPVYQYLMGSATQSMNIDNLIKRRDQHLKVTRRLVSFYNENLNRINPNLTEIIALRIKYALYQQYVIYLHMNPKNAKQEIVKFDHWVKKTSPALYSGPKGKVMTYIKCNRNTNFVFYVPATKLFTVTGLLK